MLNSIVKSLVCSSFLIGSSVCGIVENEEPCYSRESACSALGGLCMLTGSVCDGGNYVDGKCPTQPDNVQCYVVNSEVRSIDGEGGGGGGGGDENDEFEYDFATRCIGAAQPGTECLLRYMKENSPSGRSMGIYVCRNIGGSSQISLHAEGRALDWRLNVNNALQEEEAQQLINQFLANESSLAKRMGIQEIIHNRRIRSSRYPDSGLRQYKREDPHTDRIHIGLN